MLTYYKIIYKKDVGATTFARSTYYDSRIALFVETSNAKPHAEYGKSYTQIALAIFANV